MLFLSLETFNKTGGLQSASRILCKALMEIQMRKGALFSMKSLCDSKGTADVRYINPLYFKGYSYNRIYFAIAAIWHGISAGTIILCHINLLPIGYLLKLLKPPLQIILMAHGKEVWIGLPVWKKRFLQKKVEIWAVSRFTKSLMISKHGIHEDNIKILNNCLDPYFKIPRDFKKPAYLLNRYNLSALSPIVFNISRINRHEHHKGYDQVLDCLPMLTVQYPGLRYLIAGKMDAEEHKRLLAKIDLLKITDHVIFTGFIPEDELTDYYVLSDLFIMPSKKEGFGLVFLEALACGRLVIAGNKDGSIDALRNGELGCLVNPDSKEDIYKALCDGLKKSRNASAIEIQKKTIKHFNFKDYKLRVEALLKQPSIKSKVNKQQVKSKKTSQYFCISNLKILRRSKELFTKNIFSK